MELGEVDSLSDNRNVLQDLIHEYKTSAIAHGAATLVGDSQAANRHYRSLVALLPSIRNHGEEGKTALAQLTDDANESVACWSATHLLKTNEKESIATLERLAQTKGIIAFNAKMVLKQWKKGELNLP